MSRDDRDWYREAIRERDSKNKVVQFDKKRKVNKTSKKLKSSQKKSMRALSSQEFSVMRYLPMCLRTFLFIQDVQLL